MNRQLGYAIFSALLLGVPTNCFGDVIYSTLGPSDAQVGGLAVFGSAAAVTLGGTSALSAPALFQSRGNFSATSFTVAVDFFPPGYSLSPLFDAFLYSDTETSTTLIGGSVIVSHVPNLEIAQIAEALVAPSSPGLVSFASLANQIDLKSGSFYWVILRPNNPQTSIIWDNGDFEVDGTLLTPEPATFGLLTCALLAIPALKRKRISKT